MAGEKAVYIILDTVSILVIKIRLKVDKSLCMN